MNNNAPPPTKEDLEEFSGFHMLQRVEADRQLLIKKLATTRAQLKDELARKDELIKEATELLKDMNFQLALHQGAVKCDESDMSCVHCRLQSFRCKVGAK
jgi:hypothetical protein